MLSGDQFRTLLDAEGTLVIDGALATELEERGHDLKHDLWSAKVLRDSPESIEEVHYDYYRAGANVAITASYQAATSGLTKHFGLSEDAGQDLIKRSVQVAIDARAAAYKNGVDQTRALLVAGSVGPYGAFLADGSEYRGDYVRTLDELKDFHRPRIQALVDAGVDLLALETIPNRTEIEALLDLLKTEFPRAIAWLSCTMKDTDHLSDGTAWDDVLTLVDSRFEQIVAFGVNCVPMDSTAEALKKIHSLTGLLLICYPNSGEVWEATTNTWHGQRPDAIITAPSDCENHAQAKLSAEFDSWTAAGAKLIGGCCRTGPAFVRAIHQHLKQ